MGPDDIKNELDEIRKELHGKQERIKPAVAFAFIVWVIGSTVSGAWWAASMSAQLAALTKIVEANTADRYYGDTAEQDFRLRDQRMDFLQQQINAHNTVSESAHKKLDEKFTVLEEKVRKLELNR